MIRPLVAVVFLSAITSAIEAQLPLEGDTLYRATMLRATPGALLELIDRLEDSIPEWAEELGARPLLLRHSQGDHWDLMLLAAAPGGGGRSAALPGPEIGSSSLPLIAWREDWWIRGVAPEVLARRAQSHDLVHVEIFLALPDRRAELLRQRRMENEYLRRIDRQQNLIFTRAGGAPWDAATFGFYGDLEDFAASVRVPEELEQEAALAAGFEGASFIGSYLRSLIAEHHDTLAVPVTAP